MFNLGWRRVAVYCRVAGLVYDFRDDGGGDEIGDQAAGGGLESFMAEY